jgi:ABC-2 type transport system ATP-binding protein
MQADVRLMEGVSINQLIATVIQQVELKALHENIPSFNEIFIKVVGGEANEIL